MCRLCRRSTRTHTRFLRRGRCSPLVAWQAESHLVSPSKTARTTEQKRRGPLARKKAGIAKALSRKSAGPRPPKQVSWRVVRRICVASTHNRTFVVPDSLPDPQKSKLTDWSAGSPREALERAIAEWNSFDTARRPSLRKFCQGIGISKRTFRRALSSGIGKCLGGWRQDWAATRHAALRSQCSRSTSFLSGCLDRQSLVHRQNFEQEWELFPSRSESFDSSALAPPPSHGWAFLVRAHPKLGVRRLFVDVNRQPTGCATALLDPTFPRHIHHWAPQRRDRRHLGRHRHSFSTCCSLLVRHFRRYMRAGRGDQADSASTDRVCPRGPSKNWRLELYQIWCGSEWARAGLCLVDEASGVQGVRRGSLLPGIRQ